MAHRVRDYDAAATTVHRDTNMFRAVGHLDVHVAQVATLRHTPVHGVRLGVDINSRSVDVDIADCHIEVLGR